jgi:hypothetical protein
MVGSDPTSDARLAEQVYPDPGEYLRADVWQSRNAFVSGRLASA